MHNQAWIMHVFWAFLNSFTYSQKSINNLTEILVGYLRDNVQQTKKDSVCTINNLFYFEISTYLKQSLNN